MILYTQLIKPATCNICDGEIDLCVVGQSPFAFAWTGPNGFQSQEEDLTGLCPGDYTVTVTDANGENEIKTFTITENCYCDLWGIITTTPLTCNSTGTAEVEIYGGTEPYAYQWSGPGGFISTNAVISITQPGMYEVTITDSGLGQQCQLFLSTYIQASVPEVYLQGSQQICAGDTTSISAIALGAGDPFSYLWSNGETNPIISVAPTTTTTYTVTVTDANGCSASKAHTVTVRPVPVVTITAPSQICVGETVAITAQGAGTGAIYIWNTGFTGQVLQVTPGTTATYTVTATSQFGCSNIASKEIMVQMPILTVLLPTFTCDTSQIGVFTDTLSSSTGCDSLVVRSIFLLPVIETKLDSFVCSLAETGSDTLFLTSVNGCDSLVVTERKLLQTLIHILDPTFTCDPSQVGLFTDTLQAMNGCDSLVVRSIFLLPVIETKLDSFVCSLAETGSDTLFLTSVNGCDSLVVTERKLLPTLIHILDPTFTCDTSEIGVFTDTLQAMNGCDSLVVRTVMLSLPPVVEGEVTHVNCHGDSTGSIDLFIEGGIVPFTYLWEDGNIEPWRDDLPIGIYHVTVTDANGCTDSRGFHVGSPQPLEESITISNPTCHGSNNGIIIVNIEGGAGSYSFVWSDSATTTNRQNMSAGSYSFTVTDYVGCTLVKEVTLSQPEPIIIEGVTTPSQCDGPGSGTISTTTTGGTGILVYAWSDGGTIPNRLNLNSGTYSVTVTDSNGCQASTSFLIKENGCVVTYNHATKELCVLIGRCGEVPTFDFTVQVSAMNGQAVKTFQGTAINGYFQGCFNLSSLTPGVYAIRITSSNGAINYGALIIIN
jgi:hypothetical protein